jgi:sec-independent protein translocase protein TatA
MFSNIGPTELILILLVVLLLFGGKKIPEIAKSLADGIREFRKASKTAEKELDHVKQNIDPKDGDKK